MEITFYLSSAPIEKAAWQQLCPLIERAYQTKTNTFICMASREAAIAFDNLLWTYREDIFLPHALFNATENELIQIAYGTQFPAQPQGLLINLADQQIERYTEFSSVAEIVYQEPTYQDRARQRFKYYRDQGHQLRTEKLI